MLGSRSWWVLGAEKKHTANWEGGLWSQNTVWHLYIVDAVVIATVSAAPFSIFITIALHRYLYALSLDQSSLCCIKIAWSVRSKCGAKHVVKGTRHQFHTWRSVYLWYVSLWKRLMMSSQLSQSVSRERRPDERRLSEGFWPPTLRVEVTFIPTLNLLHVIRLCCTYISGEETAHRGIFFVKVFWQAVHYFLSVVVTTVISS